MTIEKYKSLSDIWLQSCSEFAPLIAFSDDKCETVIKYEDALKLLSFLKKEFISLGAKKGENILSSADT